VRPWEVDLLTVDEIELLVGRLRKMPPLGGSVAYEAKK